jgi:hypothetical protein
MDDQRGYAEPEKTRVYVSFGPLQTQEMPLEWAEEMLTKWRERSPVPFGKMLAEVVTGGVK